MVLENAPKVHRSHDQRQCVENNTLVLSVKRVATDLFLKLCKFFARARVTDRKISLLFFVL